MARFITCKTFIHNNNKENGVTYLTKMKTKTKYATLSTVAEGPSREQRLTATNYSISGCIEIETQMEHEQHINSVLSISILVPSPFYIA